MEPGRRFPCLAEEEAAALAEVGGCRALAGGLFLCPSCGVFFRGATLKAVNGVPIKKPRPSLEVRDARTMDHITARLLVNLARVRPGSRVLEPFVGTGAVARAAEEVGAAVVGLDVDLRPLSMARRNVAGDLAAADSTAPPLRGTFDAVVGDPPYGRMTEGTMEVRALLHSFLEAAMGLLRPGGYLAFASPIYVDLPALRSCAMYLHGGLYRVVYVARR